MGERALDVFDGDTAVKEVAVPREALPTGAIEAFGRQITAVTEIAVPREALPTGAIDRLAGDLAVPVEQTPLPPEISPAIAPSESSAPTVHTDKIARQRGLPPLSEPYVRERERVRVARGWLVLSIAISVVSLVGAAAAVMWARAEVGRVRKTSAPGIATSATPSQVAPPQAPPPHAPPPHAPPPQAAAPEVGEAATAIGAPGVPPPECAPPMTELTIETRPAGATVTLDGTVLGTTPLVTTVKRYEPGTLWFRAPGRVAERRKLLATAPAQKIRVSLGRSP